jgi:hypothetical protein
LTTEDEYMETTHARNEAVFFHILCSGIGFEQHTMRINCNSQSAIFLEKKPTYHFRTNHIDVQCNFVRDTMESKKVSLHKVDILENIAESLTKSVSVVNFSWCREAMGVAAMG